MKVTFLILAGIMFILTNADEDDETPDKCIVDADIMIRRCCIFPPFFTREVAKSCGAIFGFFWANAEANVTTYRRDIPDTCGHWKCVLDKYGLLDNNNLLVLERYFFHMDQWVELNPDFKEVMLQAKVYCKRFHNFELPIHVCRYFGFHLCMREFIRMSCPKFIHDEICLKQKAFFEECRQYFQ